MPSILGGGEHSRTGGMIFVAHTVIKHWTIANHEIVIRISINSPPVFISNIKIKH